MGNFYHMVFYPGGGGEGEGNPWGGGGSHVTLASIALQKRLPRTS